MAGKTFKVEVVTPERTLFSAQAESLQAPASEGSLGVLTGHTPMLCTLTSGEIKLRGEKGEEHIAVSGGFMEVSATGVIVLADAAEMATDLDPARAQKSLDRAKALLAGHAKGIDRDRAESSQRRALNRLALARKYGSHASAAKR